MSQVVSKYVPAIEKVLLNWKVRFAIHIFLVNGLHIFKPWDICYGRDNYGFIVPDFKCNQITSLAWGH
jgi:hypothetical protein